MQTVEQEDDMPAKEVPGEEETELQSMLESQASKLDPPKQHRMQKAALASFQKTSKAVVAEADWKKS